jgi:plastocyanin
MSTVRITVMTFLLALAAGATAASAADEEPMESPAPSACPSAPPVSSSSSVSPAISSPSPPSAGEDPCLRPVPASSPAVVAAVTVTAGDLWFDPREVSIPSAGATTLTLFDSGFINHNLTVDELGLVIVAAPGRSQSATVIDPPPGQYKFYCSISGHAEAGMEGTLLVE